MISIKKYLDTVGGGLMEAYESERNGILLSAIQTIRSCLREMGNCSLKVSPALGAELKQSLAQLEEGLSPDVSRVALETTEIRIQEKLQQWGNQVSAYYLQKASEVRGLLMVMARTAESFGARDQRCAAKLSEIGDQLQTIATLEDLTEVRASIQKSARRATQNATTARGPAA